MLSKSIFACSWQAAWADRENDFLAPTRRNFDGTVGRIFSDGDEPQASCGSGSSHAHGARHLHASRQHEGQRTDATPGGEAVEDAWHAATKGTARDFMPAAVNAYAASQVWDVGDRRSTPLAKRPE